ncbi:FANCE [Mytilus edulis]|uniref:FANCE n=1 Tax=Mytilus edulis TaxID=6550 RepID=A0A8S3S3G5_MYTED|nr:FANCE [Mytilus edulis]
MSDDRFFNTIPVEWRGLFQSAMKSNNTVLNRMNAWYEEQWSSKYGGLLLWTDLIQSLLAEEPAIKEGELIFVTRYSQLPGFLQQGLLAFLLHHRQFIPKSSLKYFLEGIGNSMQVDSWVEILYRMLQAYLVSTEGQKEEYLQYEFTPGNQTYANSVYQQLQNSEIKTSPWTITAQVNFGSVIQGSDNTREKQEEQDIEMEGVTSPVNEGVISPGIDGITSPDLIMLEEEPLQKLPRLEIQPLTQMDHSQVTCMIEEKSQTDIQPEDLEKMKMIKDRWESGEDAEVQDEMDLILTSNTSVVEMMCKEVCIEDMSETAMATACNQIQQLDRMISHSNCTVMLSALLLQKVIEMNQSASRILTGVVAMVAESFSKPLIEGVFVPAVENHQYGTYQADLIIKVCKEIFHNTDKLYFLELMLKKSIDITDNHISVLHALFEGKVDISDSLLLTVLESFKIYGCKLEKNLKFGKLIVALVNKYGAQMNKEHKEILTQMMMSHKSFLKKSIQAAVAKLK